MLREPTGDDERSVRGSDTATMIGLLDRLLTPTNDAHLTPGFVAALSVADRDVLAAALHRQLFGDQISAVRKCVSCGERFDLSFPLIELQDSIYSIRAQAPKGFNMLPDGRAQLANGAVVRAPTGADEAAVAGYAGLDAVRELTARCVRGETGSSGADDVAGDATDDAHTTAEIDAALEWIAPVLELDLAATCPECDAEQEVPFSLQHYLLTSLLAQQDDLWREFHLIATVYQWDLGAIGALPRSDRQRLVRLIDGAAPGHRRGEFA